MADRRTKRAAGSVKLTPADAFDLIRWLARSQSDPRKAVAELVQNAIDARAQLIVLERRRRGRRAALIVRDDGEGIRPADDREAALRYLATHIGRSHKRNLSPSERHAQVVAGKYGIGLLGFWSIGRRLDIRSRVAGSATWMLRLVEDEPDAEVVPAPPQIDAAETFTELVISEVHAAALRPLALRRLAEYLGAELRGPLSSSGATVELREYDVRGQVVDRVVVTPRRFEGARLAVPSPVAVPGYSPIVLELYQVAGDGPGGVELTCAGTVVAERVGDLGALGLDVPPWTQPLLAGTIEFADFAIPPGTRRGVIPDAAADAFVAALAQVAPHVTQALGAQAEQRHAMSERQLLGELRRALRGLRDRLPHLGLPPGMTGRGGAGRDRAHDPLRGDAADGAANGAGAVAAPAPGDAAAAAPEDEPADAPLPPTLLPPGPASHVRVSPDPIRLWPGGAKRVRAIVTDLHGQTIRATVAWTASSPSVIIEGDGAVVTLRLPELMPASALVVTAVAEANGGACSRVVELVVIDGPPAGGEGAGIPEPILADEPGAAWRSRMIASGWYVNIGHADYRALAGEPRARLRYLVALLAKDLTVATTHPASEPVLDQMIDVLTHAERNLLRPAR
jgi:hypothetical protein